MPTIDQRFQPLAVIFDLEFTAWEGSMTTGWMRPGEYQEVVQIGAVKVDAAGATGACFDMLVRPRLNPVLSTFLEQLTGITTTEINARGVDFSEAYCAFLDFADGLPLLAFGRDDLVLLANIRLFGLKDLPSLPRYLDLRQWLNRYGIDMRGMHACDVGPALGAPFEGRMHNGLCDALSIAAGMAVLLARGASFPEIP